MDKVKKANEIVKAFKKEYPNAKTELKYSNPFQLLIATILSAQTTDVVVNKVTPVLFERYPDVYSIAKADLRDVEEIIKSTGFYHQKAKYIIETSRIIMERFNGRVPDKMGELLQLKGVSRKTANVVLSNAFGKAEGIVVDTHVKRVSKRIGLTQNSDPYRIEEDLMKIFERKDWAFISNAMVLHGRYVCKARKPECKRCVIEHICDKII